MRYVLRGIVALLAVIGGFTLLGGVVLGVIASRTQPEPLPARMVLTLNLDAGVAEAPSQNPLDLFEGARPVALSDLAQTLDRAAADSRVAGLLVRLDGSGPGLAQAQEIHDAVVAFRHSGKRATLFSSELGEFGSGSIATYLASAFDEVWLQPSGDVGLAGFAIESPFVKRTFDLLGIEAQFGARWDYKTAIDMFTQTGLTPEGRESYDALLGAWTSQVSAGIADGRHLTVDAVRALMDRGPFLADEAIKAGLVDHLGYEDQVDQAVTAGGARLVSLATYRERLAPIPNSVRVALIVGTGDVVDGSPGDSPFADTASMSARRLAAAFKAASDDPTIKAILFRIDSPGGSYTAADAIRRSVEAARAAGKPVVVSMGDEAASGGYFAAMAGDRIVAEPGTITGSIGVFAGKFVAAGLFDKLGITWDTAKVGQNADIWSLDHPFSQGEWDRLNAFLDQVYADFTAKVSSARNIQPGDMDAIARGRIWAGSDAKRLKLVDELGGYPAAFTQIRALARLPSQMPLTLVPFPRPRSPLEALMRVARDGRLPAGILGDSEADPRLVRIMAALGPLAALLDHAGGDGMLLAPPLAVR